MTVVIQSMNDFWIFSFFPKLQYYVEQKLTKM